MAQKKCIHIPENSTPLQEKFINYLMHDGKKNIARNIFKNTLQIISEKDQYPEKVFEKAVENVKPTLEVRAKRIGGAVYQIPVEVKPNRQLALAFRWIIGASRGGKGAPMEKKLAGELMAAANGEGSAMKKKEDTIKMAAANKAFAHYARY
ncbi:30S ribosomal protein S7 [Patescibacteria group bacterium]|nr:30S ribosomal protein S7 [Patescibacteria group bacterium]MBU1702877.1 30S ribosomal protein S7 [Patescibacteria group bacterium]MBU1953366.1 30S ribosomal protein S7 [Patescibacteria group bacterium]